MSDNIFYIQTTGVYGPQAITWHLVYGGVSFAGFSKVANNANPARGKLLLSLEALDVASSVFKDTSFLVVGSEAYFIKTIDELHLWRKLDETYYTKAGVAKNQDILHRMAEFRKKHPKAIFLFQPTKNNEQLIELSRINKKLLFESERSLLSQSLPLNLESNRIKA